MEAISPQEMVNAGLCIGCGSCVAQSTEVPTSMQFNKFGELNPTGPSAWYKDKSEQLGRTCPFSRYAKNENDFAVELYPQLHKDPFVGAALSNYVGYVAEGEFRQQGSSGGMVTWVATELLRQGLIDGVAHVVTSDPKTENRFFKYRISRTEDEIRQGAKSRYYPVEMSSVVQQIFETPGRYAVVGIPCFIKAINLLREEHPILKERIRYTLGLFCGHMKSARFVESFAWQLGVPMENVKAVEFRQKDASKPANWYNAKLTTYDGATVDKDWWHLADGDWGGGFFMNHACNYCDDVVAETADISFGDAWVEPYASDPMGNNVVVVRSNVINQIVAAAIAEDRLQLAAVDNAFVHQTQAAGFRQRREGLSYRLTWADSRNKVRKRVDPSNDLKKDRKRIYRLRYYISKWSHKMFNAARRFHQPKIYLSWCKAVGAVYYAFAYHKGSFKEIKNRYRTFK